jgi:hypothetical protein
MAAPEAELNMAILNDIPYTIEVNGQKVDEIKSEDICPWYEPPKSKKTWRRRVSRATSKGQ